MRKTISPILAAGLLIYVAGTLTSVFGKPLPDWLAITLLVAASVLIILGGLKTITK